MADNYNFEERGSTVGAAKDIGSNVKAARVVQINPDNSDIEVVQQVAHDAADSGKPIKMGSKARGTLSGATPVSENDRSDSYSTLDGKIMVQPDAPHADLVDGEAVATSTTSNVQAIAAQGAGQRTYVKGIIVTNLSSTATAVEIKDGTTRKMTIAAPANGGAIVQSIALRGSANAAWNIATLASVDSVRVTLLGYKSAV